MYHYYRTKEQARVLALKYRDQFQDSNDLLDFVPFEHKLTELGQITGINRHGFVVSCHNREHLRENEIQAHHSIMDFILNEGLYQDAFIAHNTIHVYGRMEKGVLVDFAAINLRAFIQPSELH